MRGEEKPDEPSGPSESGISRSHLLDLDLDVLDSSEARRFEAVLGTIRQSVTWTTSGND